MNLSKHDPETDMEMNMTAMIDVVFLLIIFFILVTDLTQQELEELVLPMAQEADPDKPDPEILRPILNILQDGTIIVKRKVIYDPELDQYGELEAYLATMAQIMDKKPMNEDGSGPLVPDQPVLIRADEFTPFKMIQKVMELCGKQGIQIWKVELAAKEPQAEAAP
ncbi:MAG TPA: biopolymer transporter ExbD [Actinomycetota bacterium]|nr:biopolymer transporter ExbD [Actinomycetota bacterium]